MFRNYIDMNRKWLLYIFSAIAFVTGMAGFAMFKFMEDEVEAVRERQQQAKEVPPKTATEILEAELSGAPEAFPKATQEDIERPPAESRAGLSLEDEFDNMAPDRDEIPTVSEKPRQKEKPKRSVASVPKDLKHMFKVESSKTLVSKNLDRKKALAQLRKDFGRDDCTANTGKTKSLKAQISLAKDGGVSRVKLIPSTGGDKDLILCLKKKLSSRAKAYRSKDKFGGKLTVQLKVK